MNRRKAISNIVILSVGAAVLPSCTQKDEEAVKFKNFSLKNNEVNMLSQLSDAIIPKTVSPQAADVKAHEFTLMMIDDCYEPEKQKMFTEGLKNFDKLAKDKYGSTFISCTEPQRKELLTAMEKEKDVREDVLFFYKTTKRHTVQAFTSSKEYMTDVLKYNLVPGSNFKGCVPVKKAAA